MCMVAGVIAVLVGPVASAQSHYSKAVDHLKTAIDLKQKRDLIGAEAHYREAIRIDRERGKSARFDAGCDQKNSSRNVTEQSTAKARRSGMKAATGTTARMTRAGTASITGSSALV